MSFLINATNQIFENVLPIIIDRKWFLGPLRPRILSYNEDEDNNIVYEIFILTQRQHETTEIQESITNLLELLKNEVSTLFPDKDIHVSITLENINRVRSRLLITFQV